MTVSFLPRIVNVSFTESTNCYQIYESSIKIRSLTMANVFALSVLVLTDNKALLHVDFQVNCVGDNIEIRISYTNLVHSWISYSSTQLLISFVSQYSLNGRHNSINTNEEARKIFLSLPMDFQQALLRNSHVSTVNVCKT